MDSDDEITVARPSKMTVGFLTGSVVAASDPGSGGGKVGGTQKVSEPPQTESPTQKAATTLDMTGSSSRSSSPLSDIDEDILQTAPTTILHKLASEQGTSPTGSPPTSSAVKDTDRSGSSAADFSSSPQATASDHSSRKRSRTSNNMQDTGEPPAKRRRGRPAKKAAPQDSSSVNGADQDLADELALDNTNDDLDVRPTRKNRLGCGNSSVASRLAARARGQPPPAQGDEEFAGSTRLREKPVDRQAEKEKYEPLHLHHESNWVLFDPIKSFPPTLAKPPKFLKHYTHYKPGNGRVLEYNLVSNSIRLKRTPKALKGRSVRYGKDGPRLE